MNARNKLSLLVVGALGLACAATINAQVKSSSETSVGTPTHEVQVEKAEVMMVTGNDLIVKMDDGSIRHIANVPESSRVTVDGKEIGIHQLKPGMHLTKTITTTTTPTVITTTQTVRGKVWNVSPPSSVILTLEDGTNQQFKIPKDQKFDVDGAQVDAFHLRKGMMVNVTKVVEEPVTQVQQEAKVAGHMPPPPPAPAPSMPILVAVAQPVPMPAAPAPAQVAELPKTGSLLPLYGLLGIMLLASAGCFRMLRKNFN